MATIFLPQSIYAGSSDNEQTPRVLVAPPKYIQGPDALNSFGRYLGTLEFSRVAVLASARAHGAEAGRVVETMAGRNVHAAPVVFHGECSLPEIESHVGALRDQQIQCLIAVGGGKCVDAGKCIAHRLDIPVVVVPTLASNDAPCSALSVLYTPEGVVTGAEFFPTNPAMVVVDTTVVANADERYLVSGMGDAMATWYEARVCQRNPAARNVLGARPTLAAGALGELCAQTLYADGVDACDAVRNKRVDSALEQVVEANTLLSGVGFESGGLAGAHGFAQGYTTVPEIERNFLHGEMVAMGVTAQLMLEQDEVEARRVAEFFARVGLPVHLRQIGTTPEQETAIDSVVAGTMMFEPLANFTFTVTAQRVKTAMLQAHELGVAVAEEVGDSAWRALHG